MRWVIFVPVAVAFASPAFADDFEVLRGSQSVGPATFTRWSGFYAGGQIGYSDVSADFSNATQAPIAYALRQTYLEDDFSPSQWPVLGSADSGGTSYGGFVGYNSQWQDLILGIEANFNYVPITVHAPSTPIGRTTGADSAGNTYALNIAATGSLTSIDYVTLRARAGWVLGNFLPYGFAGVVVGQANYSVTANVTGEQNPPSSGGSCSPPCFPFAFTSGGGVNSALTYGFAVGGGLDVALTANLFVRGELEYVQFAPVAGLVAGIASARVGAGLKF